ncbi:MAG: hypothetical protein ABEJ68_08410 [Halobacteriaceae archaeon]
MTTHDRLEMVANGNGAQLYFKTHLVRDSSFPLDRDEEVLAYTTAVGVHIVPLDNIGEIADRPLTIDPPPLEAVPIPHRPDDAPSDVDADVEVPSLDADGGLESEF